MKAIQLRFMLIILKGVYDLMLRSEIPYGGYEDSMRLQRDIKKILKSEQLEH